jgi:hypothetical protein
MSLNCCCLIPHMISGYGVAIAGNRRTRRETCPSDTVSATNPTLTDWSANPGLRGGPPETNRLSHRMTTYTVSSLTAVRLVDNLAHKSIW